MRFEFNSDDVIALVRAIYAYLENAFDEGTTKVNKSLVVMECERLYRKIKIYGLLAFENRESFRREMQQLKEMIEDGRKNI